MRGPRRIDAPPPPPRRLTSDRQFLFPAANAVSYLRAHRYAPTCKLGRLESEGLLTATPTNESADVLRARREKILKGLADARHALAEWPNGHMRCQWPICEAAALSTRQHCKMRRQHCNMRRQKLRRWTLFRHQVVLSRWFPRQFRQWIRTKHHRIDNKAIFEPSPRLPVFFLVLLAVFRPFPESRSRVSTVFQFWREICYPFCPGLQAPPRSMHGPRGHLSMNIFEGCMHWCVPHHVGRAKLMREVG